MSDNLASKLTSTARAHRQRPGVRLDADLVSHAELHEASARSADCCASGGGAGWARAAGGRWPYRAITIGFAPTDQLRKELVDAQHEQRETEEESASARKQGSKEARKQARLRASSTATSTPSASASKRSRPSTVADQLHWLRQAGLRASVAWRHRGLAVIVADADET